MELSVYCDIIDDGPVNGYRTFIRGAKHYLIDGQEVTEAEYLAAADCA